jgi:hypothetical protein
MTNSTTGRDGFSDQPLLRVNFEVNNTGERELVYSPPGVSHTEFAPSLMTGEVQVPQATFSPTVAVDGAQTSRASIAGGGSYTGFLLFEAPAPDVTSLQLSLPAKRFDSTGVIRIDLSYTHREVPAPAELTPQVIEAAPAE